MFDIKKFGAFLSKLRKNVDMTQSELADKLNLTRQAISRYELGESFPDISILISIADIFNITIDELIKNGEATRAESKILSDLISGKSDTKPQNINDVINLVPFIKPSILEKLFVHFQNQEIDISNIVSLSEYLNHKSILKMLENANFETINSELLARLVPMLDIESKNIIFKKILERKIDWQFLEILLPYTEHLISHIEAAVIEGVLPMDALGVISQYQNIQYKG
ncbi:MAG: helix-turn-helix transcriptional regulator [Clostridia bacterium]|nr:helix-turn-helix transcriptional regulator [Clostridia bacterium]